MRKRGWTPSCIRIWCGQNYKRKEGPSLGRPAGKLPVGIVPSSDRDLVPDPSAPCLSLLQLARGSLSDFVDSFCHLGP